MRKPAFCICENKDADLLVGNRAADTGICFPYMDRTILLLLKSEAIFFGCAAQFVGYSEDRFSHDWAHIKNNNWKKLS